MPETKLLGLVQTQKRGRPKKSEMKTFIFATLFEAIVGFTIEARTIEEARRKVALLEKKGQIDFSGEHGIEECGDNLGAYISFDNGSFYEDKEK